MPSFLGEWYNQTRSAHSIYFQVLGEHGFVGLALFVSMLVMTFITLGRVKVPAPSGRPCGRKLRCLRGALQIGLVGYCVSGAFLNLAYFDMLYLYMILGAVMIRDLTHIPAHGASCRSPAAADRSDRAAPSGGSCQIDTRRIEQVGRSLDLLTAQL